ncbi:MAG: DNA-3-methyladenine glycosylase [Gammaproteobacteria bacterium]
MIIINKIHIEKALDTIAAIDTDVAKAISEIGYPEPRIRPDGFETFFSTIVSQQISTKAADAIWGRIKNLMININAETLLALTDKDLRASGLSQRKLEYAQGLAKAIVEGDFDPSALKMMDDEDAINAIIQLRGFGRWSAEIYSMFSLQREDIFPADDLILLSSLQKLKQLPERPTPKKARDLILHWSPWRSSGSLFLWHYHHHYK